MIQTTYYQYNTTITFMISTRMPIQLYIYFLILGLTFTLISCDVSGNDADEIQDDLSENIRELVDDELMSLFEDELDIPIHRGLTPPDVVSTLSGGQKNALAPTIIMAPMKLIETLVPDDPCAGGGCTWYDMYIRFSDQNMDDNELTLEMTLAHEPTILPTSSFISGDGNAFTIFVEQVQEFEEGTVTMISLYSGILTADGIEEPHYAGVMIENSDVDERIPNGTGQSFRDGDGFSALAEWPHEEE